MNEPIETETLHAFVDGELDVLASREVELRLRHDAALQARVEALRALRQTLRDAADYHAAPERLRARVAAIAGVRDAAPSPRRVVPSGWLGWRPLGSALAAVAVVAVGLDLLHGRFDADARLTDAVVASHVRATLGEHLVDVASSDHHTVKPWLSARLDFSPPVPDTPLPGTPFVGGRVDYLDGHPVATLVFRHGNHVVDSFVWPVDAADSGVTTTTERGFRIARWTRDHMAHWTISDVSREEFDALVGALAGAH